MKIKPNIHNILLVLHWVCIITGIATLGVAILLLLRAL